MAKPKNILFGTTVPQSINADIVKNIIKYYNPEKSFILTENIEFDNREDLLKDFVNENNNIKLISRTAFMLKDIDGDILSNCKAIDNDLLLKMSKYEEIIFSQIQRVGLKFRNFYVMIEKYYSLLRFWNDFLDKNAIDLFVANNIPHEGFDFIIYCLCKIKNINMIFSFQSPIVSQIYYVTDIEQACFGFEEIKEKNIKEFLSTKQNEIPLDKTCENLINKYFSKQNVTPFYMKKQKNNLLKRIGYLIKKTFVNIKKGVFVKNLKIKIEKNNKIFKEYKKILKYYQKIAIHSLDKNEKFIYFPLHYQPELTSNPLGLRFENQELAINLLSQSLPEGYYIYIKEHPKQDQNIYRSKKLFERLNKIKNVRLVGTEIKTEELTEKCIAVSTLTGTAAFEALFKLKPVLLFGNFVYQYCNGCFKINTQKECNLAIEKIINNYKITQKDIILFIKSLSECSVNGYTDECYKNVSKIDYTESANNVSSGYCKIIDKLFNK